MRIYLAIATLLSSVLLSAAQTHTVYKNLDVTTSVSLPPSSITASMLASGAAASNLSTMLPGLSASQQGTGVPGLNGHWFIWNKPASFDGTSTLRLDRHIDSGSGSSGGTVYSTLLVKGSTNPSDAGFNYNISSEFHNTANASTSAENVANAATIWKDIPTNTVPTTGASGTGSTATVTFSGGATIPVGHAVLIAGMTPSGYNGIFKVTASSAGSASFANATTGAQTVAGTMVDIEVGPSWGKYGICIDNLGINDPLASCIGDETDVMVQSATTDANRQRVILQLQAKGVSGGHVGRGLLFGTNSGLTIDRGLEFGGNYGIGADFSAATFSSDVLRLAQGQTIAFDNTAGWTLLNSSGSMALKYGGVNKLALDSTGNLNIPSTLSASAHLVATGYVKTAARLVSGAVPANSGSCAINTQLGGNTAGSFKANGACSSGTLILTLNATVNPTNGWVCDAHDLTTPTSLINQTAYTTSTATFSGVTMAASDLVAFKCVGF